MYRVTVGPTTATTFSTPILYVCRVDLIFRLFLLSSLSDTLWMSLEWSPRMSRDGNSYLSSSALTSIRGSDSTTSVESSGPASTIILSDRAAGRLLTAGFTSAGTTGCGATGCEATGSGSSTVASTGVSATAGASEADSSFSVSVPDSSPESVLASVQVNVFLDFFRAGSSFPSETPTLLNHLENLLLEKYSHNTLKNRRIQNVTGTLTRFSSQSTTCAPHSPPSPPPKLVSIPEAMETKARI